MIRNILAIPMNAPTKNATMSCALHVARHYGGHIAVVYVRGAPQLPEQFGLLPSDSMEELVERYQAEELLREETAHAEYRNFLDREGLAERSPDQPSDGASASWRVVEGFTPDVVAHQGGAYDMIVIGKPAGDGGNNALLTVESALFSTGRPILVAPPDPPETLGEVVLLGWNRSAQSARAFHAARAMLLERTRKVRILSVTTGAKEGPPAEDIARNLAWHGIEADIREFSPDNRSIGAVLLAEADAIGADLLVMGAYTHNRLRQILLGGVTRHVLTHARVPLFMAH